MENNTKNNPHPTPPLQGGGKYFLIATFFGAGLVKKAPGTMGSLAALPPAFLIHYYGGNLHLMIASIAVFFIGWWATKYYLEQYGGEDPKEVVIDEVAGQWLLLSVLLPTWQSYLVGFALFRTFDIVKPWPICVADQKIKGAFGVMFDDMLAAIYPIIIFLFLQKLGVWQ